MGILMGKRDYKTWAYYDENDQFMFAAEQKFEPKIGTRVRSDGVDYMIWYIEDGRGVHNVRLEKMIDPIQEATAARQG